MTYTLDVIYEVNRRLHRNVEETLAEWRERAEAGDPAAIAALEEWDRRVGDEQ
jgi:hypothetical protein